MTPSRRQGLPQSVVALARDQHWVVAFRQLLERDLTRDAIRHAVAAERLFRVYDGVLAVGRPDLTREGKWMAAALAVGDDAVVSRVPAGLLWLVLERGDERPHVTVPGATHRAGPRGVQVHRAVALDVDKRLRIPVTSLPQTLIDLAGELGQAGLKAAIRQALRRHPLDLGTLRALVEHPRTDHRRARVRRVLDLWVPNVEVTQSELEARFYELVASGGLPLPELQRPFGPTARGRRGPPAPPCGGHWRLSGAGTPSSRQRLGRGRRVKRRRPRGLRGHRERRMSCVRG